MEVSIELTIEDTLDKDPETGWFLPATETSLYVTTQGELSDFLEANGISEGVWSDDLIDDLGYASWGAMDDALYSTGILKSDIISAFEAL